MIVMASVRGGNATFIVVCTLTYLTRCPCNNIAFV